MSEPSVCCIMLANGRPSMVERAVKSFEAQTYPRKFLFIFDTSPENETSVALPAYTRPPNIMCIRTLSHGASIGRLRNAAGLAFGSKLSADLIAHWDSDDHSHPSRLEEQVGLLESSGANLVGYSQMLFWNTSERQHATRQLMPGEPKGEAWIFTAEDPRYMLGTSMLYRRSVWEKLPFEDVNVGEDDRWQRQVKRRVSQSSLQLESHGYGVEVSPRMIASIHGSNTCAKVIDGNRAWKRVPEWDSHCERTMKLCG